MPDVELKGIERFVALSRALRSYNPELRKQMNRRLKQDVQPLIPAARAAARLRLPQQGGLAARVAAVPMRVQVRAAGRDPGVRVVVSRRAGSGARAANRGYVRRPTFGREPWVNQQIQPGWFDDTMKHMGPRLARPSLERTIDAVLSQIVAEYKARQVGN